MSVDLEGVTPDDFEQGDAYDDERGLERCPACKQCYSANGLYSGPVWDSSGRRFDLYLQASAGARLFCEDCWPTLDRNRKQTENNTLGDFA